MNDCKTNNLTHSDIARKISDYLGMELRFCNIVAELDSCSTAYNYCLLSPTGIVLQKVTICKNRNGWSVPRWLVKVLRELR